MPDADILSNYEEIRTLEKTDAREKVLVRERSTSGLFVKTTVRRGNEKVFEQLKREHMNLIRVHHVIRDAAHEGGFILIEDYFERTVTLRERLAEGIDSGEFDDYMMQICDILIFLFEQKPPIVHGAISAASLLVCDDNVLKLTNFENAEHGAKASVDIATVGRLLDAIDGKLTKRFRSVIRKCEHIYQSPRELQKDIFGARKMLGMRYAVFVAIAAIVLVLLRLFRVGGRLGGLFRNVTK
jgi:hypothetical protein